MRILGNINHERLKITVFEDNNKIIVQCEDGLCQLTYKYRIGSAIEDFSSIQKMMAPDILNKIEVQIGEMKSHRSSTLEFMNKKLEDEFPVII